MPTYDGKVVEALPNALFWVELENGKKILSHVAGTDRTKLLRLVPGDRVAVELSSYDITRGRITKRYR